MNKLNIISKKLEFNNLPSLRQSSTGAFNKNENKFIIFGGYCGLKYFNDIYEFDCNTNTCEKIDYVSDVPIIGRIWHSCLYLEHTNKLIIFGGETNNEDELNDMLEYDINKKMFKSINSNSSIWPPPVSGHSTILRKRIINNEEILSMVIFGGTLDNKIYEFNFKDQIWTYYDNFHLSRISHNAIYHEATDKMYIFGGKKKGNRYNELWCYDFSKNNWEQITSYGEILPTLSSFSCFIFNKDYIIIFGGYCGNSKNSNIFYCYNVINKTWNKLEVKGDSINETCNNCLIKATNNKLYLFGGYNSVSVTNECFELTLESCNIISQNPKEYISNISTLWTNKELNKISYDITFLIQGKPFNCHKFIISRSQYLKNLINLNGEQITIKNISEETFEKIIEMLYGIDVAMNDEDQIFDLVNSLFLLELHDLELWILNKYSSVIQSYNDFNFTKESTNNKTILNPSELLYDFIKNSREIFNDLKIDLGDDKLINVHKILIMAKSAYFKVLFSGKFSEIPYDTIQFENVSELILNYLIDFIYGKSIILNGENTEICNILFDICKISNMLLITDLEMLCLEILYNNISFDNLIKIIQFYKDFGYKEYFEKTFKILDNHYPNLAQRFKRIF